MFEKISGDSALLLICYAIGGWLVGATSARLRMPRGDRLSRAAAPAVEPEMHLWGLVGLVAFLALAWVGSNVYVKVSQALGDTITGAIARGMISAVGGALLGGSLALVIVVFSFQETLVAFLDYMGAPVLVGGAIGGAVGAVRTTIAISSGQHWATRALVVATAGASGFVIGLITGLFCGAIMMSSPSRK